MPGFLCLRLYLIGTNLYLVGTHLYLRDTNIYLIGTDLYLKGTHLYLNFSCAQKSRHGSLLREVKSWAHWAEGYDPRFLSGQSLSDRKHMKSKEYNLSEYLRRIKKIVMGRSTNKELIGGPPINKE